MPKQVWQADDGQAFDTEAECLQYEKLKKELGELMMYEGDSEKMGFQEGFGETLNNAFYGEFKYLWEYRDSLIKLGKKLDG